MVAPVRERGLKCLQFYYLCVSLFVAPVRERGLKLVNDIESAVTNEVAPVRERGLKRKLLIAMLTTLCRSRKGAWIEIAHAHMDGVIIP